MSRVAVYVDGFNLYFGLRQKGWRKLYWLDLGALGTALLKSGQTLSAVHYFTSRIRSNGSNDADRQRQNTYLEALEARGVQIQYGHYLEKRKRCHHCGAAWMSYEEKMTDVNIAVQLISDAHADNFDVALVLSGDSDLTTPIRNVRSQYAAKRVIVAFPPARSSFELQKAATAYFTVGETNLRQSQLPDEVRRADGFVLKRPTHWH